MANQVVWFEVPALDIGRAKKFYETVLDVKMLQEYPEMEMLTFPHTDGDVSGCIYKDADFKPSDQGSLMYFNVEGRIDDAVSQVEQCGGRIKQPKEAIGPYGFRAIVLDSEGNKIALHSMVG